MQKKEHLLPLKSLSWYYLTMEKGIALHIDSADELAFFARVAAICGQSESTAWQTSLQEILALFAEVGRVDQAAILLLDEIHAPLTCMGLDPASSEPLCAALITECVHWRDRKMWQGLSEHTLPDFNDVVVRILPIPPHTMGCKVFVVLVGMTYMPARPLLETASSLLTPLMFNIRSRLLEHHPAMLKATSALTQVLDPEEVLDQILKQLAAILPHAASNVMLLSGLEAEVVRSQGYERFKAKQAVSKLRLPVSTPNFQKMIETRQAVVVPDTQEYPDWITMRGLEWIRSNVSAPIIIGEHIIGFIQLDSNLPGFFTEPHAQRLKMFSDYVAIAIQNARLYQNAQKQAEEVALLFEELKRRQTHLESLYKVAAAINSTASLDDILNVGIQQAIQISNMEQGAIYLINSSYDLELHAQYGFTEDELAAERARVDELGYANGGWGPKAFLSGGKSPRKRPRSGTAVEEGTHISLPLVIEMQAVGVMQLNASGTHDILLDTQQLLSSIADQLALAMQRGRLTAQMREQLQSMSNQYKISAELLYQEEISGIIYILLHTLTDTVEGTLITGLYRLHNNGQWTRDRVHSTRATPDPVRQKWSEGPAWEVEYTFLNACYQEKMLVLASRRRGRTSTAWKEIENLGVHQIIYFPLFLPNEDFFGVVGVLLPKDRSLTGYEFQLTWMVIQQAVAAIIRTQLYDDSRKNENRLRAILESSRDGIFLLGHDLTVHYINGQALRMLRLSGDMATWEDRALSEVVSITQSEAPHFANWLTQVIEDINKSGFKRVEEEVMFETSHGLTIKLQRMNVKASHEPRPGLLLLLRDITEQRALEQMRDDLLSMLVHDMRSPLSVIQNAIQLLEDPAMRDVGDEVLGIAMNNTGKLLGLVSTILEIGRLESGRFDLAPEAVYFPNLVYTVAEEYALTLERLKFRVSVPQDMPLLWIDPAVIGRVLTNLMSNALKFVSDGGTLRITASLKNDWVRVEVYNSGPHISPDIFKRLFQKFVAGEYNKRGYGLGLSFCRLAIEAHGGKIWARNQPSGGVSFFFTIPVFQVPDFPDEDEKSKKAISQGSNTIIAHKP